MTEENTNGKQLEHRLTKLEVTLENVIRNQDENHSEIMEEFKSLRSKVNEEITTMQDTIGAVRKEALARVSANRKFYIRLLAVSLAAGSLIWIAESRAWILSHIFHII